MLNWDALVEEAISVRKEEQLTQKALAAISGVTAPTVIKFESGSTSIKVDSVIAILGALGLANKREPQHEAIDKLADLYSEGIHEILNRPVLSEHDLDELVSYEREWQKEIRAILRESFPRSEFVLFTRLGAIPATQFDHNYSPEHAKILREYVVREERLRDMLRRYSGKVE